MGLVRNETVRVDIGRDFYLLRKRLGWYDETSARADESVRFMLPRGAIDRGEVTKDELVEVKVTSAERNLRRLEARIMTWSHGETLNRHNIKRLPPDHAKILLSKIQELEKEQQEEELTEDEKKALSESSGD